MTGGRCHRRKKMMGRGAVGGCGTEERLCPVSRVPVKNPATPPAFAEKTLTSVSVDFFSRAKKSLCLRSPFDSSDEALVSTVPTLPSGLARFLSRQSDSRKRHKKSHSGAEKKKKSYRSSEKSKFSNIWVETEEYFRHLTMSDVDALSEVSLFSTSATGKYFLIPGLGNARGAHAGGCREEKVKFSDENGNFEDEKVNTRHANEVVTENSIGEKENEIMIEEDDGQSMEIDGVEDTDMPQKETSSSSVLEASGGFEWLLGSKNKICLTTERPSKKRKLLGGDAGLEKVLVASSCDGNTSLCHFCSTDDSGKDLNQLVSCSSCQVSVHRKCYGVQEDVDSSWLCSWCKQTTDSKDSTKPCVLCPKQGGALKPAHRSVENDESVDFAHLFCAQWMPDVYVEDLVKMEPIMNIKAIKETHKKLVCNVCKVKWGACIRCSHGSCRTSFHPLCAREASHRMEVWGKRGSDNIELRAFCSKHSEVLDKSIASWLANPSVVTGSNSDSMDHLSEKENVSHRNGENTAVQLEGPDIITDMRDGQSQELGLLDSRLNARPLSGCNDSQPPNDLGTLEWSRDDVNVSNSNFILILKKLVDRGRLNVEDVASEIGISSDSLSASLADETVVPDVLCKILEWFKQNVHLSSLHKNLKESDVTDLVAVKSVPPRRRTKGNIGILNDPKMLQSSQEILSDKESIVNEVKADLLIGIELDKSSEVSILRTVEKNLDDPGGVQLSTSMSFNEGTPVEPLNCNSQQSGQAEEISIRQDSSANADENPPCSVADLSVRSLLKTEAEALHSFYMHPDICKKLMQMQNKVDIKTAAAFEFNDDFTGSKDGDTSPFEVPTDASDCCLSPTKYSRCEEKTCKADGVNLEELGLARKMGILNLSPKDEVEGEIIYHQNRLLSNAVARERLTDNLKCNVAKSLPREVDLASMNRWDDVLATQYLYELREAKKQGRKERRHKEAQAVLAAATAAAAASSRSSSFRKDAFEEATHQENMMKLNTTSGRFGGGSQPIPRAKEMLQRVAAPRILLEKQTDFAQSLVDFSKEHPRSCDICRRSESILNPILVCCSCKVAVHLDCYRSVKESTGPWYCELCEELSSSRSSGAPAVNFWEKPYFVAECGLCGGTTGAFRKSSNGQWVHAFCAEWVFESRFKRGQVNSVEEMETVSKAVDLCLICRRKYGACIKCNYGHCQATFHPSCARSAGFHMNIVKTSGGKQQHKAYCEKHSLEQRAKVETQRYGIEELKRFKQVRVELERLRLLCDRIIKREKLKRDLVFGSHEILAAKRDHAARSLLVQSSSSLHDASSESVTTSLKGNTDGYKSCSEAIQRSDDITVDSTISVKHRSKVSGTMDDQRMEDDCTTSHNHFTRKHMERPQYSGKQIPHRPVSSSLLDDGGWRSKLKKQETFEKELVMTSDQANVKNMRLPKGYAYVPADCLSNEKQINQDSCFGEPLGPGG